MRALAAVAALLLATLSGAAAAQAYHWKDRYDTAQSGATTPRRQPDDANPRPAADDAPVRLRLVKQATRYQAWADNRMAGPAQVRLDFARNDRVIAAPALPARALVPAHGSVLVAEILLADTEHGSFGLALEAIPGNPAARPRDYEYRLPFDHAPVRVDQGPEGAFSHDDAQNRDAIDFALPEGTPVLAARAGTVMQVESDHGQAGPGREKHGGRANYIRILHDDGSMAVYAHLQAGGVQVRAGQAVSEGQRIGLSGNSGFSTAPHLHFAVQVNRGMRLESIPVRVVGPFGELRFPR